MQSNDNAFRLRIYASSTDKVEHGLLSEFIVREALKQGLAGATAMKGMLGYGASSVLHSYKIWEVNEKVPVIIEIVDLKPKLDAFLEFLLPLIESLKYGFLVTMEPVQIVLYRSGKKKKKE